MSMTTLLIKQGNRLEKRTVQFFFDDNIEKKPKIEKREWVHVLVVSRNSHSGGVSRGDIVT